MTPYSQETADWVIENTVAVPEFWVLVLAVACVAFLASLVSRP